jgi:hypothetical protein
MRPNAAVATPIAAKTVKLIVFIWLEQTSFTALLLQMGACPRRWLKFQWLCRSNLGGD